jgi:arsenite methyltransferase
VSTLARARRPDYGLDAPPVVRNLLLAALGGLMLWGGSGLGLWSGVLRLSLGGNRLSIVVAPAGLSVALGCGVMALWMIWSSRVGKVRGRERLLDRLRWSGAERVLDVGCGRGLLLVGAAKRLTTGQAVGIDLWRAQDLAGNAPAALWANARAEGVADRVSVQTADMRRLPFGAETFDVILSQAAVHNLRDASDRRLAIEEIARVLRPAGEVLVADIRHLDEYAAVLRGRGLTVTVEGSRLGRALWAVLTAGALRPGVLHAGAAQPAETPHV